AFVGTYEIDGVAGGNSVTFNPVVPDDSSTSAPLLSIALADPLQSQTLDNAVVSWPATPTGFVLQTNTDLTTTNWGDYLGTVDTTNGIKSVTLPKSGGSLFFRLKH